jgi:hypothetical protein
MVVLIIILTPLSTSRERFCCYHHRYDELYGPLYSLSLLFNYFIFVSRNLQSNDRTSSHQP